MKRQICVVVTARASYARIKSALRAIADHPDLELQLVVAASAVLTRFGDAVDFIEKEGFEIAARVYSVVEGETPLTSAKTTGMNLMELATCFDNLRPDAVVTVADRYETLATAVAASYMNIPLVHIQGGEVTGSIDEKVRHAVTKLADIHLVSTKAAEARVIRMGEPDANVFLTGCPSIDLARQLLEESGTDTEWFKAYGGVGPSIDISRDYLVAMQHPVTTEFEDAQNHIEQTLEAVYEIGIPTFWFWPNVDAGSDGTSKGMRRFRASRADAKFHFFRNMSPADFLRLAHGSLAIVGNSSFGIRESSYLGLPTINIGTRQQGREHGRNVKSAPYKKNEILSVLRAQLSSGRYPSNDLYGDGYAGAKIADILSTVKFSIEKRLTY